MHSQTKVRLLELRSIWLPSNGHHRQTPMHGLSLSFGLSLTLRLKWQMIRNAIGSMNEALNNQHAVAVAVKAVALFDGFLVGLQYQLATCQRSYQY